MSVLPSFRPSFRPSVRPSFRPSRFVSGAEHKNRERYLNQTWHKDRSIGELVPFDSLGYFWGIFWGFLGVLGIFFWDFFIVWGFFGDLGFFWGIFFWGIFYSLGFFWDFFFVFLKNFLKVPFDSLGFLNVFFYYYYFFKTRYAMAGDMSISC